ncbi:hypothetical protein MJM95_32095, partial [Salmonella enterica subsp. enterica serovar Anatum]|nr:hypothetical protein [Salmonella enterica subsp. enterica serovar Anatum]
CGTIGTMLTFVVTGPIVAHSGPQAALLTANGLYAVVFVMCFAISGSCRFRRISSKSDRCVHSNGHRSCQQRGFKQ